MQWLANPHIHTHKPSLTHPKAEHEAEVMRLCVQAAVFKLQQTQEMKKDVRAENKGYANIWSPQQQDFTLIAS